MRRVQQALATRIARQAVAAEDAAAPRPTGAWACLLLLVLVGLGGWPLSPLSQAAPLSYQLPSDAGLDAPAPALLHAGGALLPTALGTTPDPAPPVPAARTPRQARASGDASAAPVPTLRTRAQRLFGRRNLDGG